MFLDFCSDLGPVIKLIKNGIIPIIQFGIPIILIVLGMLDFGKAVMASKEDEIKNAQKMFIKRLIYAVAVFLVVVVVTTVFNLLVSSGASKSSEITWRNCWDKF